MGVLILCADKLVRETEFEGGLKQDVEVDDGIDGMTLRGD